MPNSITKVKEYVNDFDVVYSMHRTNSYLNDLLRKPLAHTGATISYDDLSFDDTTMGIFDRTTGYPEKGITLSRKEKTLSQDRGDKLFLDKMDDEEAQARGIVRIYNNYLVRNVIPTMDKYVLEQLLKATQTSGVEPLDEANVVPAVLTARTAFVNKRVRWEECVIYMKASVKQLLDTASFNKGYITVGSWNGSIDTNCTMFKGAKIVEVPDDYLGLTKDFVVCHPLAVDFYIIHQEAEFFDRIPGHGARTMEVDVGEYFDCWIAPNGGEDGVYVHKNQ